MAQKGRFSKVLPQGLRGRREMFLTSRSPQIRPTLWTPDRDFTKGNAAGLMKGEQNAYLLRKIEFNAKNKVNHLRKQLFCSQHTAPFFFGSHPITPKEKPLVSASSEALQ